MALTILHTSDWHIGKPFGRFESEQAGHLRRARLTVIGRLAETARSGQVRHVLVAGDVFDRPGLSDRDLRAPLGQMQAYGDLAWHIIPGNHDPAVAGGIWERAVRDGLPGNVHLHLEARPVEIAERCWLLPAPLAARAMSQDPTAWMDTAATPDGALRIGLAHGSIQGFGSEHSASIEIAPDRARRAGLDYLALGDWHGVREIGARAAYSGTPEPDGFLDNAPGFALLVSLDGPQAVPSIVRRETGEYRWLQRSISAVRTSDLAAVEGEIEGLGGANALRVLMEIDVSGRVTMAGERDLRRRLDRLEARLLHLARRVDRMVVAAADDDIERLAEGPLRAIGTELSRLASNASCADQTVAQRALRHLFELADTTTGAAPIEASREAIGEAA